MSKLKYIFLTTIFILAYVFAFLGTTGLIISLILILVFIIFLFIPINGTIIYSINNMNDLYKKNKIKNIDNFMPKKTNKIAVMLSGGVDSSVVIKLLLEDGYEVEAFFMRNWDSSVNMELNNILTEDEICQQEKDYNDAMSVAKHFDVKLHRVDFVKEYWDYVFEVFLNEIKLGLTPNPDILCNRHIKFGKFIEYLDKNFQDEFKYVATGHYAKIIVNNGIKYLVQAKDSFKDQTYFLAEIKKEELNRVIFPLADLEKKEIREIAVNEKIPVATKKDSVGICFIGKRNFPDFISNYLEEKPGKIIDKETGEIVGKHRGVLFYTHGQRKGLNLGGFEMPYFVSDKDIEKNILFVSSGSKNEMLFTKEINAKNFNYLIDIDELNNEEKVEFKTRHSEVMFNGRMFMGNNNSIKIISKEKIKYATPGQELVIYKNGVCIGGGQIV